MVFVMFAGASVGPPSFSATIWVWVKTYSDRVPFFGMLPSVLRSIENGLLEVEKETAEALNHNDGKICSAKQLFGLCKVFADELAALL